MCQERERQNQARDHEIFLGLNEISYLINYIQNVFFGFVQTFQLSLTITHEYNIIF